MNKDAFVLWQLAYSGNHHFETGFIWVCLMNGLCWKELWAAQCVALLLQERGLYTTVSVVKTNNEHVQNPLLPFMPLMDWKTLHGTKLCIYAYGDIKKISSLSNISASEHKAKKKKRKLAAEGTWGDNLIFTNNIACTEAPASHNSKQYSIPFVVDWLLLGFAFLFWFSWQCS